MSFPVRWPVGEAHQKADLTTRLEDAVAQDRLDATNERRWNAEIDDRDHRQCRACGRRSDPEAVGLIKRGHRAHIVYASAGGSMEPFNRVTLCGGCHLDEHRDRLRFSAEGGPYVGIDANAGMEFWRKDADAGYFYLSRRETAPHILERD